MKLTEWKTKYPTSEDYYDAFHESQEGQKIWQQAYDAASEDWDEESDDEEPLIIAHDIVMDGMEGWVLDDVDEAEYDQAGEWFETLHDDLSESVFAGLT
jgi:hypothetical protein